MLLAMTFLKKNEFISEFLLKVFNIPNSVQGADLIFNCDLH